MEPKIRKVHSSLIKSDPSYQRPVDMKRVTKIVNDFDPQLVNYIKVSLRGKFYYVFDGQHTLEALKQRNGGKDLDVKCLVYEGLSRRQEAMLFADQNGFAKAVGARDKLKAKYTGGDKEVIQLVDLVERAGLEVDFEKSNANNRIVATAKLEKIFRNMDNEDFVSMLTVIKKSWNGAKDSLVGEILGGMYVFYKIYEGQFDEDKLIKKLSTIAPQAIVRDGKGFTLKGDAKFALVIVKIYNHKNRSKLNEALLVL